MKKFIIHLWFMSVLIIIMIMLVLNLILVISIFSDFVG